MDNAFSRLKHHRPNELDPQENHATESLAACLMFSSKICDEFIAFLFDTENKPGTLAETEVTTQYSIEGGGYIDLILRQGNERVIAVEIKVKAVENSSHHTRQLQVYRRWLNNEAKGNGYLFTLVRSPDLSFDPTKYGAKGRRTWTGLYKRLQNLLRTSSLSDVEINLIRNFCSYLESEAIVSAYETKDLLSYSAGLKARKAVTGIFSQIADRLKNDQFETTSIEDKKDSWPQLRIQHPDWKTIFGQGENRKITLWFCVPGVWGIDPADQPSFIPEIELWHIDHGNDWNRIKLNLARWLDKLKAEDLQWAVLGGTSMANVALTDRR